MTRSRASRGGRKTAMLKRGMVEARAEFLGEKIGKKLTKEKREEINIKFRRSLKTGHGPATVSEIKKGEKRVLGKGYRPEMFGLSRKDVLYRYYSDIQVEVLIGGESFSSPQTISSGYYRTKSDAVEDVRRKIEKMEGKTSVVMIHILRSTFSMKRFVREVDKNENN